MKARLPFVFFYAFILTSFCSAQWTVQTPMTTARGQHAAVAHPNGNAYVWGGFVSPGAPMSSLEIYNQASNTWSAGAPIPQATRGMAFALGQDSMIYSFGGFNASHLNFVYRYNVTTNSWSLMSPMPTAAWESTAATGPNGNIFVFGGEPVMNLLQIYNPVLNIWGSGASLPVAVRMASATNAPNGKIYVMGGFDGGTAVSNNQIYDPALNSWSAGAPLPNARNQFGASLGPDGKIYVVGGKNSGGNNTGPFFDFVDIYDPVTDSWTSSLPVPATIGETEAVTLDGALYLMGGTSGTYLTSNYRREIALCMSLAVTTSPSITICIGQNTNLTANISGGNPGYTYQWSSGHNTASINVNPIVTTTYTVTVLDTISCMVISQPVVVSVSPPLSVGATGSTAICHGASAQVSALATGGDGNFTYSWTPSIGSGPGPHTVNPTSTTTYVVSVTDGCGTPANPDSVTVIVNPLPDVSFSGTNITGCTPLVSCFTDLSVVASGSVTQWLWTFGDATPSSAAQHPCHSYSAPGLYTVTLTATTNAGCSQSFSITDYVESHPVTNAAFTYTAIGLTVYFLDNSPASVSWNWNFGDSATDTVLAPIHTYSSSGQYIVCLTAPNIYGCSDTACVIINVTGVGIDENNSSELINIFPNPANNRFTIYDVRSTISEIGIYDVNGRQIFCRQLKASSQRQVAVDVFDWNAGVYFVRIMDSDNNYRTLKFIKL